MPLCLPPRYLLTVFQMYRCLSDVLPRISGFVCDAVPPEHGSSGEASTRKEAHKSRKSSSLETQKNAPFFAHPYQAFASSVLDQTYLGVSRNISNFRSIYRPHVVYSVAMINTGLHHRIVQRLNSRTTFSPSLSMAACTVRGIIGGHSFFSYSPAAFGLKLTRMVSFALCVPILLSLSAGS